MAQAFQDRGTWHSARQRGEMASLDASSIRFINQTNENIQLEKSSIGHKIEPVRGKNAPASSDRDPNWR